MLVSVLVCALVSAEYCDGDAWILHEGGLDQNCTITGLEYNATRTTWHAWNNGSIEPESWVYRGLAQFANDPDKFGWVTFNWGVAKVGAGSFDYSGLNISNRRYHNSTDNVSYWFLQGRGDFSAYNRDFSLRRRMGQLVNMDYVAIEDTLFLNTGSDVSGSIWAYWELLDLNIDLDNDIDILTVDGVQYLLDGTDRAFSWVQRVEVSDAQSGHGHIILNPTGRRVDVRVVGDVIIIAQRILNNSDTLSAGDNIQAEWRWIDPPICTVGFSPSCIGASFDRLELSYTNTSNYNGSLGGITHLSIEAVWANGGGDCTLNTISDGCILYVETLTENGWQTNNFNLNYVCAPSNNGVSCSFLSDSVDKGVYDVTYYPVWPGNNAMRAYHSKDAKTFKYWKTNTSDETPAQVVLNAPLNGSTSTNTTSINITVTDASSVRIINYSLNGGNNLSYQYGYGGNWAYPNSGWEHVSAFGCDFDQDTQWVCTHTNQAPSSGGTCRYSPNPAPVYGGVYSLEVNDSDSTATTTCDLRFYTGTGGANYRDYVENNGTWEHLNVTATIRDPDSAFIAMENYGGSYARSYLYPFREGTCYGIIRQPTERNWTVSVRVYAGAEDTCYFDDVILTPSGHDQTYTNDPPYIILHTVDTCITPEGCINVTHGDWLYGHNNATSLHDDSFGSSENNYWYGGSTMRCGSTEACGDTAFQVTGIPDGVYEISVFGRDTGTRSFNISFDNITSFGFATSSYGFHELAKAYNVTDHTITFYISDLGSGELIFNRIHMTPIFLTNLTTVRSFPTNQSLNYSINVTACDFHGNCGGDVVETVWWFVLVGEIVEAVKLFMPSVGGEDDDVWWYIGLLGGALLSIGAYGLIKRRRDDGD